MPRYRLVAGRVRLRLEQLEVRETPAVANPDTFTVTGSVINVPAPGVLANDTVGPGESGPLVASLGLLPQPPNSSGTVTLLTGETVLLNSDGSFTFFPAAGFSGVRAFNYFARGSGGTILPAATTVTLNINPPAAPAVPPGVPPPVVPPPAVPPPFTPLYAVGAGGGAGPRVSVFNADGSERFTFFAFDESFRGGVRVAVGDVTGDGTDDIVATPGDGGGPVVRVFDGVTGRLVRGFELFGGTGRVGLHVAAGDLNADGFADIVVGVGSTGGPVVQAIDGATGAFAAPFFAYDPAFRGGVRVAVGDVDGDGAGDIVTVPGPSGGPVVRVFDAGGAAKGGFPALGDSAYRGGAFVAVLGGTIVVAPDSFPGAAGTVLDDTLPDTDGATPPAAPAAGRLAAGPLVVQYTAGGAELARGAVFGPEFGTGVRVSAGQYRGTPGLFVTPGPAAAGRVRFFALGATPSAPVLDVAPFAGGGFSLYVGGSDTRPAAPPPTVVTPPVVPPVVPPTPPVTPPVTPPMVPPIIPPIPPPAPAPPIPPPPIVVLLLPPPP